MRTDQVAQEKAGKIDENRLKISHGRWGKTKKAISLEMPESQARRETGVTEIGFGKRGLWEGGLSEKIF